MPSRRRAAAAGVNWQLVIWGASIIAALAGGWFDLRERVKVLEATHELSIEALSNRIEEMDKNRGHR